MSDLLVCSHRGPVTYQRQDGRRVARPAGPGGLVAVVAPALARFGGTWMYAAASDEDREVAGSGRSAADERGIDLHILDLPREEHRQHYQVASVGYLGMLFHHLFQPPYTPSFDSEFWRAWESYRYINEIYAHAVGTRSQKSWIFVQDYHLMLLADRVGSVLRTSAQYLAYFHHVPWVEPDYFSLLPTPVGTEILRGMLAHDVLGFHSHRWARAFEHCCAEFLPRASVSDGVVHWRGSRTRTVVAPTPLDAEDVAAVVAHPATRSWAERFGAMAAGRKALVRVDRVDLWKNPLRGFLAFEALLERRPDLADTVWFLAVLSPTRCWLPQYRRYLTDCEEVADRVNARFGTGGRLPVTLDVRADTGTSDRHRALGGLSIADIVLVNPIFDGLNLVAKECALAGGADPVLILSRNAGVHDELSGAALGINPFDILDTAAAIEQALDMPDAERTRRAAILRAAARDSRPEDWVARHLPPVSSC